MMRNTHVLCALVVSLPAIAAQSEPATSEPQVLRKVRVEENAEISEGYNAPSSSTATKTNAPLRDIPQTVNVIPAEVLADQHATSLQDVMKNVPGIGQSHGDGQRDQVSIRGFSAISDQFVDGFRDDALYFRDLSNVERVEVIKGPAAVLYGRGSSGGLINRVTKKPGIDLNEIELSYGSWDDKRTEMDVARRGDVASWRVTGALEDADSYRDQQFLKRTAFAPSVSFDLGSSDSLLLQADYLRDKRLTDFGIPAYRGRPVDVPPETYFGAANAEAADYSEAEVYSAAVNYVHRFSNTLSLRNGLRYYDYDLDRNNTLPSGPVNEVAQTVQLNRSHLDRKEHGWFNQTELTQQLSIAGQTHEMLYGVEVGQQNKDQFGRSQSNVAIVSLFDPVLPTLALAVAAAPNNDNTGIAKTQAAYMQDLATITEHWKALVGIRFDRFEQQTEQHLAGQPNLSRVDKAWSPRAGLVWQPTDSQSYYASWSRSFQPSGESFAITTSNADLEPEKTVNQEVGAKLDFLDGRLSATGSLFRLERNNIKSSDPITNRLIPIGTQRTDGLELTLSGDLGSGWKVLAGYAYLDTRVTESIAIDAGQAVKGKHATITPQNSANLWITKSFTANIGFGAGANYVDDRFANPGNTVVLPSYTTADAMAWYRVGQFDFQLNIRNLFDREYIIAGHGSNPNLNLPGAPRSATLSLRVTF
jgi:catecholate siderophore receptor